MALTASVAPDITEALPATIAARTVGAKFLNNGLKYDVAFGGLPFILAPSQQRPYRRQTANIRKQQIDTSREFGEQTLDQWWTRAQSSWHRGEGIKFYEPGTDPATEFRFGHSMGVDVWTKGQVSLLRRMDLVAATAGYCYTTTAVVGGVDSYFVNLNGVVQRRTAAASTVYTGATPTTHVVVGGAGILAGDATNIYSGSTSGSTLAALWTSTAGATLTPYWAKNRIIATRGAALYELSLVGGALPATPTFTHPSANWSWSAVAEGPTSILASGSADGVSSIYSFTLTTDAGATTPKLGQPFPIAAFPPGEVIHSMRVYLGTYVALGTSRGLRIGQLDGNGNLSYGPLLVETANPVRVLSARDSFVYAGVEAGLDGQSGVVRVNLAEPGSASLVFAWAWDVQSRTLGQVQGVSFLGNTGQVVLGVQGQGVYLQSATNYEVSGYVTSGKIRYATSELKDFRRARVGGTTPTGTSVGLFARDVNGSETFLFRYTEGTGFTFDGDLATAGPQVSASIRLDLVSNTAATSTPVLDGLTVKALPAVRRQRMVLYPVLCSDSESDRNDQKRQVIGGASQRLFALEELESTAAVILVQDFTNGEAFEAQIDTIEFTRTSPADKASSGFGGIATITVRKL